MRFRRSWLDSFRPHGEAHGHTHFSVDYPIGATRVLANTRGYPDETATGFDPALVVEV
jgi:hypothetical protein